MCAELFALGVFWMLVISPWLYTWALDLIDLYNEEKKSDQ